MQGSGGALLAAGWTAATPYFAPQAQRQRVPFGVCLQISAFFVVRRKDGLERTAPVCALVQKLRAGEQFLVRGRVHGSRGAIRRIVNCDPSCFIQGSPHPVSAFLFMSEGTRTLSAYHRAVLCKRALNERPYFLFRRKDQ